jgi:RNA polymerase sigma-70 factor, ECF subfamily
VSPQANIRLVATPLYDLLARFAPDAAKQLGDADAGEARLTALCVDAAAGVPDLAVDGPTVVTALAEKISRGDVTAATALTGAAAAEVHLALALARGVPAAVVVFDRDYLSVVPQAVAGMNRPAATIEDIRAAVRDKLLLPGADGAPPRIVEYAGQGRLRGLVQVTATRIALDLIRRDAREAELPAGDRLAAPGDVELSLIKAQYRDAFAAGFAAAVATLDRRDRNLLRLHFLGRMTLEQLAQMYNVHRATVVRWLAAARDKVMTATRDHVARQIAAPDDELDEMFALVHSRVELSVERLLASVEVSRHR